MDWKKIAAVKASVLELILKRMLEKEIPAQLVDLVNHILIFSSKDIESLKTTHERDFKRFVQQASGLTVVIWWHSYEKSIYREIWPHSRQLSRAIEKLIKTVEISHKLLARKCEKKYWIRKIFVVLAVLGKKDIKEYLRKLDSVAADIQKLRPNHIIDINSILLEAIGNHENPQLLEAKVKGNIHVNLGTKQVAVNQEPVAEGSRQQEVEKSSSIKTINQKSKYEATEKDDPVKHKGSARKNEKETLKIVTERKPRAANLKIYTGSEEEVCEGKSEMKPRYEEDEERGKGTFRRVQTASPTQPKKSPRKEENQGSERPRKGKRTSTGPAGRSPSTPPPPQSGPIFNHYGSGTGNFYHADISNVGNDNSVNVYHR